MIILRRLADLLLFQVLLLKVITSHALNAICLLCNNATAQPSQKVFKKQRKNRKTFLNPIHCCQTNTHFFWTGRGWEGGKYCCTVCYERKKLSHVMSVNTDTLNCNLTVRQCYALMAGKLTHLAAMSPHTNGTRHLSQWFIREKLKGGKGWGKGTIQRLNKVSNHLESIVLSTWSWC